VLKTKHLLYYQQIEADRTYRIGLSYGQTYGQKASDAGPQFLLYSALKPPEYNRPMNTVEGSLDIHWSNSNEASATPKYRLLFARYAGFQSGAQQTKMIVGGDALEAYLTDLGFEAEDAKAWVRKLREQVSVSIPNVILQQEQLAPYLRPSA